MAQHWFLYRWFLRDHVLVGASPSAASYHMIMILHNFRKILQHQHATSLNNHAYNKRTTKTIQHQHPASLRETCGRRKKQGTEGNFRSSWLQDLYPGAIYNLDLNYRYTLPETSSHFAPENRRQILFQFFQVQGGERYFAGHFSLPSTSRPYTLADPCSKIRHHLGIATEHVGSLNGAIHEDTCIGGSLNTLKIDSDPQRDHRKWHQSQTGRKDQGGSSTKASWVCQIRKPSTITGSLSLHDPTRNRKSQFGWRMGKCGETQHNDPMSQDHHDPHTSQTFAGAADEELADRWH